MRIAIAFLLFLATLSGIGQDISPDHLILDYDEFYFVFQDQDSVRTHYAYFQDFDVVFDYEDIEAFSTMDDMIEENYYGPEVMIATQDFLPIRQLEPGTQISFQEADYRLKIIDDSHYLLFEKDSTSGGFWTYRNHMLRYKVFNTETFDLVVLLDGHDSAGYLLLNSDDSYTAMLPQSEVFLKGVDITPKEPYENTERYQDLGGYTRFTDDGLVGVKDIVTDRIILPAAYDCVSLKKWITACKDGKFGVFDFKGREVLPLAYKDYLYSSFRNDLLYLGFDNKLYSMNSQQKVTLEADPSLGHKKVDTNFKSKQNFILILNFEDVGYQLAMTYKADEDSLTYTYGDIDNADQYKNFFFDSGNKTDYIARYNFMFGKRPNGKLDLFNIHHNHAYVMSAELDDYKLIRDFKPMPEPYEYDARLVIRKNGLYQIYPYSREEQFLYKEVYYAYDDYFRVQFKDGRLGWATRDGRQYPDLE